MRRAALAAAALALLASAAPAHAGSDLEVGIADDRILLSQPERAPGVVARWAAMGIETVRIHARWVGLAPAPNERREPEGFRAADPDDPRYNWHYLDRAIDLVVAAGIKPILAVTGSGPVWSSRAPHLGNGRYKPDPIKYAEFATAVSKRYRGRVRRYLLWNEPNQPGWLQPQFECHSGRCSPAAPHIYRALVRAGYSAIRRVDPHAEVIAGTLAPRGGDPTRRNRPMRPLTFIRAFGCVDGEYRRIRTGGCRKFKAATIDGFSHHPHGVMRSPGQSNPQPDEAAIADLPRLEQVLDTVQDAGGFNTRNGGPVPIHLTEFGYQTDPPDPYSGVTPSQQKRWLQQAAYVAWADPRVRTLVQYEWEDEPVRSLGEGRKAFSGWQSGLYYANGRPKPALAVFPNPFWAESRPGASKVRFWGQVRPGGRHIVSLYRRAAGARTWRLVEELPTDARGYWHTRRPVSSKSYWRFTYDASLLNPGSPAGRVASGALAVTPPSLLGR